MKRVLVGVALLAAVGSAGAQTFVPRLRPMAGGSWSSGSSTSIDVSAQRLVDTQTLALPSEPVAPRTVVPIAAEIPTNSPALPVVPISGAVLGVAAVSIGVGTKSRWHRSRA